MATVNGRPTPALPTDCTVRAKAPRGDDWASRYGGHLMPNSDAQFDITSVWRDPGNKKPVSVQSLVPGSGERGEGVAAGVGGDEVA